MDLTCLNCFATFTVDDQQVLRSGGRVTCPKCGTEQVCRPIDEGQVRRPPPRPVPPRVETPTTSFKKPMSVFFMRDTSRVPRSGPKEAGPSAPPESPSVAVAQEVGPAGSQGKEDGPLYVRSPTGLSLVFPSVEYLTNWASIIESTAAYQVSRDQREWISLADYLTAIRQGRRGLAAFKLAGAAAEASQEIKAIAAAVSDSPKKDVKSEGGAGAEARPVKYLTSQFEFKILDPKARARRRSLFILGIVGLIALGAAVAAYFVGWL